MERKLNILVVEDHILYRRAVVRLVERIDYIDHVGQAGNGIEALTKLENSNYDMVFLDISMPKMDGIACMEKIRDNYPGQKVVVLTQFESTGFYKRFSDLGAYGYLLKDSDENELEEAIRQVIFNDRKVISDRIQKEFLTIDKTQTVVLTEKEIKVVKLMCKHMTSEEIANRLCLSVHTVSTHRRRILRKIGGSAYTEIISWALNNDIVPKT